MGKLSEVLPSNSWYLEALPYFNRLRNITQVFPAQVAAEYGFRVRK